MRNPEKKCIYTCKILDGGFGPQVCPIYIQRDFRSSYSNFYSYFADCETKDSNNEEIPWTGPSDRYPRPPDWK